MRNFEKRRARERGKERERERKRERDREREKREERERGREGEIDRERERAGCVEIAIYIHFTPLKVSSQRSTGLVQRIRKLCSQNDREFIQLSGILDKLWFIYPGILIVSQTRSKLSVIDGCIKKKER